MTYDVTRSKTIGNKEKCFYCGITGFKMTKDHYWPRSKGGALMVYSCHNCNGIKADMTPTQWVYWIENSKHPEKERMLRATVTLGQRIIRNGEFLLNETFNLKEIPHQTNKEPNT